MPVAVNFVLRAMAHQGHGTALGQLLEQAQGKFLAVVFDGSIALVHGSGLEQFLAVTMAEFGPGDFAAQESAQ